jgi:hypothetical protein
MIDKPIGRTGSDRIEIRIVFYNKNKTRVLILTDLIQLETGIEPNPNQLDGDRSNL